MASRSGTFTPNSALNASGSWFNFLLFSALVHTCRKFSRCGVLHSGRITGAGRFRLVASPPVISCNASLGFLLPSSNGIGAVARRRGVKNRLNFCGVIEGFLLSFLPGREAMAGGVESGNSCSDVGVCSPLGTVRSTMVNFSYAWNRISKHLHPRWEVIQAQLLSEVQW